MDIQNLGTLTIPVACNTLCWFVVAMCDTMSVEIWAHNVACAGNGNSDAETQVHLVQHIKSSGFVLKLYSCLVWYTFNKFARCKAAYQIMNWVLLIEIPYQTASVQSERANGKQKSKTQKQQQQKNRKRKWQSSQTNNNYNWAHHKYQMTNVNVSYSLLLSRIPRDIKHFECKTRQRWRLYVRWAIYVNFATGMLVAKSWIVLLTRLLSLGWAVANGYTVV